MTSTVFKNDTIVLYRGRPLNSFTYDELLKIAEEGWRLYHEQIQSSISAMRTLNELHKAARQ